MFDRVLQLPPRYREPIGSVVDGNLLSNVPSEYPLRASGRIGQIDDRVAEAISRDGRIDAEERRRHHFLMLAIEAGAGKNAASVAAVFQEYVERPDPDALIPTSAEEAPAVDNPSETPAAGDAYDDAVARMRLRKMAAADTYEEAAARFLATERATERAMGSRRGDVCDPDKLTPTERELASFGPSAGPISTHDHATEPVSPGDMSELGSDTGRASEGETLPVNDLGGSPATEADADPVETFSGPASTDPEEPVEDPASDAVEFDRAAADHDAGLPDDVAEETPAPRQTILGTARSILPGRREPA